MKNILKAQMIGDIGDITDGDDLGMDELVQAYKSYGDVAAQAANKMNGFDKDVIKEAWVMGGAHSAAAAAAAHVVHPLIIDKVEEAMIQSVIPTYAALNQVGMYHPEKVAMKLFTNMADYVIADFATAIHFPIEDAARLEGRGWKESVGSGISVAKSFSQNCGNDHANLVGRALIRAIADTEICQNLPKGWDVDILRSLKGLTSKGNDGSIVARKIDTDLIVEAIIMEHFNLQPSDIAYYSAWYQALNTHICMMKHPASRRMKTWPGDRKGYEEFEASNEE
jgi:hypothetical protein